MRRLLKDGFKQHQREHSMSFGLKNCYQIEHSRHCSPVNCCVYLPSELIAYCHQPQKPSLDLAVLGIELHD